LSASAFFSRLYSGTLLAELVNIDNSELQKLLNEKTVFIEVRRAEEWAETGVIESSHYLPSSTEMVILICRNGLRSKVIGNWMVNTLGYQTVYNVKEGILSWKRSSEKTVNPSFWTDRHSSF
jgi:rhodanese-related sulfurtransferase